MTTRFRPSRPLRFAAVTAAALGLGVPAALALTDAPERPKLQEPVVRSAVSDDDAPEVEDEATTTTVPGEDDADEDISGPCDEAEHANDPECAGVTPAPAVDDDDDDDAVDDDDVADADEDISGPCDEAEHADDPRCTGVTTPTTVDDDDDEVEVEDHSGPGRGIEDDDDHSGSGHDGDDGEDDRSGSNSGRG